MSQYSTQSDRKDRYGGILEIPFISNFQRNCLDYGRVQGLVKALRKYDYHSVLDIGCGLGETSAVSKGFYVGLDNSFPRIAYARKHFPESWFFVGDARFIPVKPQKFDLVMMIDTSHHLTNEQFESALKNLSNLTQKYIVISDPILTPGQGRLSTFFYGLDRGGCFRREEEMAAIIQRLNNLQIIEVNKFTTFPSLYTHAAFILVKK